MTASFFNFQNEVFQLWFKRTVQGKKWTAFCGFAMCCGFAVHRGPAFICGSAQGFSRHRSKSALERLVGEDRRFKNGWMSGVKLSKPNIQFGSGQKGVEGSITSPAAVVGYLA
jgi:hypothetical protein